MFKLAFFVFLLSQSCYLVAQDKAKSIIPSKTERHLFYLYKDYQFGAEDKDVFVDGVSFALKDGEYVLEKKGKKQTLLTEEFLRFRRDGSSVYEALTGGGMGLGTAFLIAKDLILTNQHVAATTNEKRSCGKFGVYLNTLSHELVKCKQVLYCDTHDFCLIEMQKTLSGKSLGEISIPLSFTNKKMTKSDRIFSIGNAYGLGVQGGIGQGAYIQKHSFDKNRPVHLIHFAPTLSGSSGSPLFNEEGGVVGINYAHSGKIYDEKAFNWAVPSTYILEKLKQNVAEEYFSQISVDKVVTAKEKLEFKKAWHETVSALKIVNGNMQKIIYDCLLNNDIQYCTKSLLDQIREDNYSDQLPLSENEQLIGYLVKNFSFVKELEKLLSSKVNPFYKETEAICHKKKDFTVKCEKEEYFRLSIEASVGARQFFTLLSDDQKTLLKLHLLSQIKISPMGQSDRVMLSGLIKDTKLAERIFYTCLGKVKRIEVNIPGFFDMTSSLVFHDACSESVLKAVQDEGYKYDDEKVIKDFSITILATGPFNQLNNSFKEDVMNQWRFFLKPFITPKKKRKDHNQKVLDAFIKKNKLESLSTNELYELLLRKMKFMIL